MTNFYNQHPYFSAGVVGVFINDFVDVVAVVNEVDGAWTGIFPWSIGFILLFTCLSCCANTSKEYQQRNISFFMFGMLQVFLTPTLISAAKMSPWSSIGISSLTTFAASALVDAALTCRKSDEQVPLMRV